MTRSTVGLPALLIAHLCVLFSHVALNAATLRPHLIERNVLPSFDTSYYLITAPQKHAIRAKDHSTAVFAETPTAHLSANSLDARADMGPLALTLRIARGMQEGPPPALRDVTPRRSTRVALSQRAPQFSYTLPNSAAFTAQAATPMSVSSIASGPVFARQSPAPVPLPAGAWLLASALAFGVFFRRRTAYR